MLEETVSSRKENSIQNWEYIRLGVSYSTRSITTHDSVYELVDIYSNGIKILSQTKSLDLYDYLNKLGTEGWELVNIHLGRGKFDEVYYLKRPVR
jgi:hypothetical protein